MNRLEYESMMWKQVVKCIARGYHNWVHGQYTIYCWDCLHNGTVGFIDHDSFERDIWAASVPLDLVQMKRMLKYPYESLKIPFEYKGKL